VRILVLHPGALGDLILALPALDVLRETHPGAELTVAGDSDHLRVVARAQADRIVSLATLPLHRLHGDDALPRADLELWEGFERIVAWTGAGDSWFERRIRAVQPGARVAAWRPGPGERRHVSQIFVDSLEPAEPRSAPLPRIGLDKAARPDPPGEAVVLHPGAGSPVKRWPEARFVELGRRLRERGLPVEVLEGPAEPGAAERVAAGIPGAARLEGLELDALAPVLRRARGFVGNDSGVSHLAAALGVPTVAVFGPTDPRNWAPRGPRVRVLRGAGGRLDGVEAAACLAALDDLTS
jgi:ADP-heptose:LPS heptosyltransferase